MKVEWKRFVADYISFRFFLHVCAIGIFTLCVTASLFFQRPREIHAAGTTLLGDTTIEATQDSNTPGMAEAFQTTATASGTVSSVTVYVDSPNSATKLIVGLYSSSSGKPATLLSQGSSTTTLTNAAWNTVTIPPIAVTANTVYWIALLGTGGTLYFRDGGTNCSSVSSSQSTLTSLPASWSTGHTWSSCRLSAYGSASSSVSNPILSISSSALSFSATQGGSKPASSSVNVTNTGAIGTINFTAASDASWLAVSPTGGTTSTTLVVSATVGSLTTGTYTGHVTVIATTTGTQGSPATITVTFTVAPPPTLSVSKTSISFSATQGGSNPASSSLSVTNAGGGGSLGFTAASDSSWLTVSPTSGTTSATLTVSAKVGTLTAWHVYGQHHGHRDGNWHFRLPCKDCCDFHHYGTCYPVALDHIDFVQCDSGRCKSCVFVGKSYELWCRRFAPLYRCQ